MDDNSSLKMGTTLLDFTIEGKTPSEKEILNSSSTYLKYCYYYVGILLLILFLVSIFSTGYTKKELNSVSGRKSWNLLDRLK